MNDAKTTKIVTIIGSKISIPYARAHLSRTQKTQRRQLAWRNMNYV